MRGLEQLSQTCITMDVETVDPEVTSRYFVYKQVN